jgi:CHAT domain-containing protein
VLTGISVSHSALGQEDAAIASQQRALDAYRRIKFESGISNSYRNLGDLYLQRNPTVSVDYFQRSLSILQKLNFQVLWPLYVGLARAFRQLGELDRAIRFYEQAVQGTEASSRLINSVEHKAAFIGKHHRFYQELIEALLERHQRSPEAGDDLRAYAVYERAKARAMLESLATARVSLLEGLAPDLRRRQAQLDAQAAVLQQRLSRSDLPADQRLRARQELDESEDEREQLLTEIKRRSPRYAAMQYPRPLSAAQAQATLDAETALISYALTPQQTFAFVLTAGGFHVKQLPVSPQLMETRVQNYVQLIATEDNGGGWRDISRRLHAELFEPLRESIPAHVRRLIIIPDGALHYLPFESLIGESAPGVRGVMETRSTISGRRHPIPPGYLLQEFVISYAPSATVLAELTESGSVAAPGRADLLMFANPRVAVASAGEKVSREGVAQTRALYEDEGLQVSPIPFTIDEATAVGRHAGAGSEIYTEANATERRLKASDLTRFRILHFATHGFVSRRSSARSALVLAPDEGSEDGFLQAREVYQLKLASDLVVLSACHTARGQLLPGEGVQGLAQAFFYAGSTSVVASLWSVNDARTATLMEVFYRHLSNGASKAEALRAAKLDLIGKSGDVPPRYWAAFIMMGEGRGPVQFGGWSWWQSGQRWFLIGGILALAALTFFTVVHFRATAMRTRPPTRTTADS